VADTLTQLTHVLRDRDDLRESIVKLEREAAGSTDKADKARAKLEKQSERLSSTEQAVNAARKAVADELASSRAAVKTAEAELNELESRHLSGEVSGEPYDQQREVLQLRASSAERRATVRERALQAESAKDLNWLSRTPADDLLSEEDAQQAEQMKNEVRFSDWPGMSVPERIMMLRRESRKPHSRRPIIRSAVLLGILSIVVLGITCISSKTNPRDVTDFLGRGDFLVPVLVEDAEFVRTLEFTLQYDTDLVRGISVVQGDVGRLAFMQYDVDPDGTIEVTLRDVLGIEGSGSIVIVRFTASDILPDPIPVSFASVRAQDVRTMEEMQVEGNDGWINTETLDVLAPVIRFP